MIKLMDLHNVHAGRPAAILGGGTALRDDMQLLPPDTVLIAVNDHAFHIGVEPDYMVVMDDPKIKPELSRIVREWRGGLRVNELLDYSDVDLRGVVRPELRTGIWSAWLAMYLGCAPILLCGMDLYTNPVKYCHPHDEFMGHKYIFDEPLENHIKDWRKLEKYPGHKRIRAMSGPLIEVFGAYNML